MRSRVTPNELPTSSRVRSQPSSMPKRILMILSSRGLSVFSNDAVCSSRLRLMAASEDDATALSSVCGRKYVDVGDEHHVKDT